jgi:hypothetical protein
MCPRRNLGRSIQNARGQLPEAMSLYGIAKLDLDPIRTRGHAHLLMTRRCTARRNFTVNSLIGLCIFRLSCINLSMPTSRSARCGHLTSRTSHRPAPRCADRSRCPVRLPCAPMSPSRHRRGPAMPRSCIEGRPDVRAVSAPAVLPLPHDWPDRHQLRVGKWESALWVATKMTLRLISYIGGNDGRSPQTTERPGDRCYSLTESVSKSTRGA